MMRWMETLHTWVVLELITMMVFVLGTTVLEMLTGHADGRTLVGHSGSYTLQNVTAAQALTTTHTSIGLDIDYIPPTGTKTVLYRAQFQIRFIGIDDPILHFKATWDGNDLEPSRSTFRVSSGHQLIYNLSVAIEVNASSVDIPKARIDGQLQKLYHGQQENIVVVLREVYTQQIIGMELELTYLFVQC